MTRIFTLWIFEVIFLLTTIAAESSSIQNPSEILGSGTEIQVQIISKIGDESQTSPRQSLHGARSYFVAAEEDAGFLNFEILQPSISEFLNQSLQDVRNKINSLITTRTSISTMLDINVTQLCDTGDIEGPLIQSGSVLNGLTIYVSQVSIDGVNGALGRAAPCAFYIEGHQYHVVIGIIELDLADFRSDGNKANMDAVILHETLHALGFGTLWPLEGLLRGMDGDDPVYIGDQAVAAYAELSGIHGASIPVENLGTGGTRFAHWRTSTFGSELMTGLLTGQNQPLSMMTAMSLSDIGYSVNFDSPTIEAFDLSFALELSSTIKLRVTIFGIFISLVLKP